MASKKINLKFYQLCPYEENLSDSKEEKDKIKAIFENLSSPLRAIVRYDDEYKYAFRGELVNNSGLVLGCLLSVQKSNIPPIHDSKKDDLTSLDLPDDSGLGYESCFLYDPSSRILILESITNGVSIGAFCALLNRNSITQVQAVMVVDPVELDKINKMSYIRRFSVKIAKVEDIDIGKDKSVGQVLRSAKNTNTSELVYSLNAGGKKFSTLNIDTIKTWAAELLGIKNKQEVLKLVISGKEDEDSSVKEIDLIKQWLKDHIKIDKERLVGSMDFKSRHDKLVEIFKKHKPSLRRYELKKI